MVGIWWSEERYASDYFQQLYDWTIDFIKKENYVDSQTSGRNGATKGTPSRLEPIVHTEIVR